MKKITVVLSLLLISIVLHSQKVKNKIVFDPKANQKILIGQINRKGLEKKEFKTWFVDNYQKYEPKQDILEEIMQLPKGNLKIEIVLATWCSDSRREVPRFLKILDNVGFDNNNLKMFAVDRNFKCDKVDLSHMEIKKVPTFIFYIDNQEIGRIIEIPKMSLEEDFLFILQQ